MPDSVLDTDIFGEMRDLMGDALHDFIMTYLDNSPQLISKIESGISQNNPESIYHGAHQLKGGSGSIGALKLAAVSFEIEKIGKSGSVEGVSALLAQLKTEYSLLETELKKSL
jgi:two-component system, sensor histidine kinase and response regulator